MGKNMTRDAFLKAVAAEGRTVNAACLALGEVRSSPVTAEAEDYILDRLERLLEKTDRSRD